MQPPQKAPQFKSFPLFSSAAPIFLILGLFQFPLHFVCLRHIFPNWIHFSVYPVPIPPLTQLFDVEERLHISGKLSCCVTTT